MPAAYEIAQEAHEAAHPPRETAAYYCESDEFEFEVAEGQDTTCPICSRPGEKL